MVMRKALHAVNELGVLFGESINLRNKFDSICVSGEDMPTTAKLRPLCQTRWTVRMKAVSTALDKYQQVLETLREVSETRGHVGIRSAGLLEKWGDGYHLCVAGTRALHLGGAGPAGHQPAEAKLHSLHDDRAGARGHWLS